jgi:hypothetical protein
VALAFFEREPKGVGNGCFRRLTLRWVGFILFAVQAAKPNSFSGFTRCQCSRGPGSVFGDHCSCRRSSVSVDCACARQRALKLAFAGYQNGANAADRQKTKLGCIVNSARFPAEIIGNGPCAGQKIVRKRD